MNPDAVREVIKNNERALATYNEGRNRKTWGNVLLYGGLGLATINVVSALTMNTIGTDNNGNITTRKARPTLAIIGGAMIVAAIPIKVGHTRKIKTAIDDYNKSVVSNEEVQQHLSIIANSDGFGIKILF